MNWMDFKELIQYLGIPGSMMAAMLYALYRGYFITRREAMWLQQSAEEREDEWQTRFAKLESEKDMWRRQAIDHLGLAERAVDTARSAAQSLPPGNP